MSCLGFAGKGMSLRRGGFTLREYLLLGGLLSMLLLAVIPFLKNKENAASSIVSQNNLVQWGIGLNLYLIDHNNQLPQIGPSQPDAALADAWYNALPPYLSQAPWAELQPSGISAKNTRAIIWNDPAMQEKFGRVKDVFLFPYAMNRYLQPNLEQASYRIFDLQTPGSVIFLSETAAIDPGLLPGTVSYRHARKPLAATAKASVLFVDGHVAAIERATLSAEPPEAEEAAEDAKAALPKVSWLPFVGAPKPGSG